MNKRIGYGIGLLLMTVGVGIPTTAAASNNDVNTSNLEARRIEVSGTANQGWHNGDEYALGVDPFGGFVEPSSSRVAGTGSLGWEHGDQYALGVDPFAGIVEPSNPRTAEARISALRSGEIGLTDLNAHGVDPYGGITEPGPSLVREAPNGSAAQDDELRAARTLVEPAVVSAQVTALEAEGIYLDGGATQSSIDARREAATFAADHRDDVDRAARPWVGAEAPAAKVTAFVAAADDGSDDELRAARPYGGPATSTAVAASSVAASDDWNTNGYGVDPFGGVVETSGGLD